MSKGKPVVASLSELGWVTDPKLMMTKLLGYYMLTDYGQSVTFQDKLLCISRTYMLHINQPLEMSSEIKRDLAKLYGKHFDIVEVETSVKHIEGHLYGIMLFVSVLEGNESLSLGSVIEISPDGIDKIIEVNNIGDGRRYLEEM